MSDYQYGCDIVGAGDKVYTDKKTVKSVQAQLHVLALATGNSSFDPGKIDGLVGPHTNAAVSAFNKAYGWPADGTKITDGTLTALKRPDVVDPKGYDAQQAADAAVADVTTTPSTDTAPSFVSTTPHSKPGTDYEDAYSKVGIGVIIGTAAGLAAGLLVGGKAHRVAGAVIGGVLIGPAIGGTVGTLAAMKSKMRA